MRTKVKILKQVFPKPDDISNKDNNYRIFKASPINTENAITLDRQFSFSIVGECPYLDEGEEYDLELKLEKQDERWGNSYSVVEVFSSQDFKNLTRAESERILEHIASKNNIKTLLDNYSNFIELILTEGVEAIDTSKLYNIKEAKLNAYARHLNVKFKFFALTQKLKDYNLSMDDCKKLILEYKTIEKVEEEIKKNPYYVLIDILDRPFIGQKSDGSLYGADIMLVNGKNPLRPDLKDSDMRCEYMMLHVLHLNEIGDNDNFVGGSTRLNGKVIYEYCKDYAPELVGKMKDVAMKCYGIYIDEKTNDMAKMSTYAKELGIANFVHRLCTDKIPLDWDWKQFTEIKEGTLTEEQQQLLRVACEERLLILDAPAGCVDYDTEYFDGTQWKKIGEYQEGDLVLQYRKDGVATLVQPQEYIKQPCDELWHFKTKYGLEQCLSDEHRVIYINDRGHLREISAIDMINKSNNTNNGFTGKFITTFNYNGQGIELTDIEIKIMCAVISDGSFYSEAKPHQNSYKTCRFHIKKERKKVALRNLFKEANIEWRESESASKGYTDFYIQAPRREKEFLPYWYNCTKEQLKVVCDNIIQWDGSVSLTKNNHKRMSFSTAHKSTADFIQFAFSSNGYKSVIRLDDRVGREKKVGDKVYYIKKVYYDIIFSQRNTPSLNHSNSRKHTEFNKIKTIDGYKYCFTVDSGMLVLRKAGKIFITGNSGKSSSVMALLKMIKANSRTFTQVVATGKGAKVLQGLSNEKAVTIHRLHLKEHGTMSEFIIVDEYSFLDVQLLHMLLQSIHNKPQCRLILVGNKDQLPSIGAGNIAQDLLSQPYIPRITLTKCFRYNSSGMAKTGEDCRQGVLYIDDKDRDKEYISYGEDSDYSFYESDNTVEQIAEMYEDTLNEHNCKPIDLTVITPQKKGELGTMNINKHIQAAINPISPKDKVLVLNDISFKKNDLVLNTRNNYEAMTEDVYNEIIKDPQLSKEDFIEDLVEVMNGEVGTVLEVNDDCLKIQFDEQIIVFTKKECYNLLLAYCITCHKLQGSTIQHAIVITNNMHKRMLCRELSYVALTRARQSVTEVGSVSAISYAVKTTSNNNRNTFLRDLLKEVFQDEIK